MKTRQKHLAIVTTAILISSYVPLRAQSKEQSHVDWERMKACAAQAEKVMRRPDMRGFNLERNHYSPKYGRCFMIVSSKEAGSYEIRMDDAFEGTVLAIEELITPAGVERDRYCSIDDPDASPASRTALRNESERRQRVSDDIDERMNH